jgi:hypothetical protein
VSTIGNLTLHISAAKAPLGIPINRYDTGKHMCNSEDTREVHVLLPGETAARSIRRNVGRMFEIFHVSQKSEIALMQDHLLYATTSRLPIPHAQNQLRADSESQLLCPRNLSISSGPYLSLPTSRKVSSTNASGLHTSPTV